MVRRTMQSSPAPFIPRGSLDAKQNKTALQTQVET
jgi:hypothetical protein